MRCSIRPHCTRSRSPVELSELASDRPLPMRDAWRLEVAAIRRRCPCSSDQSRYASRRSILCPPRTRRSRWRNERETHDKSPLRSEVVSPRTRRIPRGRSSRERRTRREYGRTGPASCWMRRCSTHADGGGTVKRRIDDATDADADKSGRCPCGSIARFARFHERHLRRNRRFRRRRAQKIKSALAVESGKLRVPFRVVDEKLSSSFP